MTPKLRSRTSGSGEVLAQGGDAWRLALRAGPDKMYDLAQIDDYSALPRWAFPWRAPFGLRLSARVSEPSAAGTWGFGLWNDPFAMNLLGGSNRSLPVLPNAVWFFYALPPNYLTLRDDAPGHGLLAQVFRSPKIPPALLAPAGLGAPLLAMPRAARLLRRAARRVIAEDAARVHVDVSQWHIYELTWEADGVRFSVDGMNCLVTRISPRGPLGLVLWIDNQFMAFPPDGRLRFGRLPVARDAMLELSEITVVQG